VLPVAAAPVDPEAAPASDDAAAEDTYAVVSE